MAAIAPKAAALTVISPVLEIEGRPGEEVTGLVKVFNETAGPLTISASVEPFAAKDESGQPQYVLPEEKSAYLKWFTVKQETLTLKSREAAVVPFSVDIAANAIPGGYYAVIFWQPEAAAENGTAVGISSQVGTLVFLKVKGELREKGEIVEFDTTAKSDLVFGFPLNFVVRFNNSGNIHVAPAGEIIVRNWLGGKISLPVNAEKKLVLPASVRRFEIAWVNVAPENFFADFWHKVGLEWKLKAIGPQIATLSLAYGSEGKITESFTFWFFPWRLLLLIIGGLLLIYIFIKINGKVNKLKYKKINKPDQSDEPSS